jgi:hypothetical protein
MERLLVVVELDTAWPGSRQVQTWAEMGIADSTDVVAG